VLELRRSSRLDVRKWLPLVSHLRRWEIDILHAHKFGSNAWGTVLGRLARVPVIIAHEHTWSYEGRPVRRLVDRELIARGADAFLAVSKADRRRMVTVEGINPGKVRYLPNGIPAQVRQGIDVRAQLGIPAGAPVVGAVGHLRKQKAFDVLVVAAGILASEFPELRVLIVGAGEEREQLGDLIRASDLEETVLLTGARSDIPDVLAAVDVAVLSSDFEGAPLTIMEYMAAEKPVVATAVGGVPDLVEHAVEGLLVPPRNPEALAAAVATLLRDPARARAMGARGRERQQREFSIESFVRRLEHLYVDLWDAAGSRRS
jgi:glycosyltransferase involved in cell wall biosynthesis